MPDLIRLSLAVIPEPAPRTRSVLDITGHGPAIVSDGPITAECGRCGNALLVNVGINQVQGVVVRCGSCRAYNESNVYQMARDGLRFLIDQNVTVAELGQLLDALKKGRNSPDALTSQPDQTDLVKRFSDLIPKSRQDYYAFVLILITLLTLWMGKKTLDKTQPASPSPTDSQVQQIVDDILRDQGIVPTPARVEKIGRNDPCWCGSDKKYKFCHGAS